MTTIEFIEKVVCNYRQIDPCDLKQKTRKLKIRESRQIIMYLAFQCSVTLTDAAGYYGLDHATASNAKRVIGNLCFGDRIFREEIEFYRSKLSDIMKVKSQVDYYSGLLQPLTEEITSLEFRLSNLKLIAKDIEKSLMEIIKN